MLACKTATHDVINAASFHVCAYSVLLPRELQLSSIVYDYVIAGHRTSPAELNFLAHTSSVMLSSFAGLMAQHKAIGMHTRLV